MIKYTQMFLLKDSFLIRMERLNLKFYCNIRAIHKLTFVIIFYQVNSELTGDVSGLEQNAKQAYFNKKGQLKEASLFSGKLG